MLFTIFGAYRKIKKGTFDTKDFAVEQAMDTLKGTLIIISAIALPVIAFLGILGFTGWLIGPSGVARFFFWIFAVLYLIWFLISRAVYKRIKRAAQHAADKIL